MRVTLERQPGGGYRAMEGTKVKTHIGYVTAAPVNVLWWAFDLQGQLKGVAARRIDAARLLRRSEP